MMMIRTCEAGCGSVTGNKWLVNKDMSGGIVVDVGLGQQCVVDALSKRAKYRCVVMDAGWYIV